MPQTPQENLSSSAVVLELESGWRICRKIIQEKVPFGPHASYYYQLD